MDPNWSQIMADIGLGIDLLLVGIDYYLWVYGHLEGCGMRRRGGSQPEQCLYRFFTR